jgi:hypothetical protein
MLKGNKKGKSLLQKRTVKKSLFHCINRLKQKS